MRNTKASHKTKNKQGKSTKKTTTNKKQCNVRKKASKTKNARNSLGQEIFLQAARFTEEEIEVKQIEQEKNEGLKFPDHNQENNQICPNSSAKSKKSSKQNNQSKLPVLGRSIIKKEGTETFRSSSRIWYKNMSSKEKAEYSPRHLVKNEKNMRKRPEKLDLGKKAFLKDCRGEEYPDEDYDLE